MTSTTATASVPLRSDEVGRLFGQTMGLVALTAGLFALGAYIGRDLSGGWAIWWFLVSFAVLLGMNACCWVSCSVRRAGWPGARRRPVLHRRATVSRRRRLHADEVDCEFDRAVYRRLGSVALSPSGVSAVATARPNSSPPSRSNTSLDLTAERAAWPTRQRRRSYEDEEAVWFIEAPRATWVRYRRTAPASDSTWCARAGMNRLKKARSPMHRVR
jgi:hypothetical protein